MKLNSCSNLPFLSLAAVMAATPLVPARAQVAVVPPTVPAVPVEDPLTAAINKNDVAAAKAAIAANPKSVFSGTRYGSPLYRVISGGKVEMLQVLLDAGVDPNQDNYNGSALSQALGSYSESWRGMAEALIAKGALVDNVDNEGMTPLMRAINGSYNGSRDKVQFLLEKGASITARNRSGKTVVDLAISGDNVDVARLLLAKADVKTADDYGNTLLHSAVQRGNADIVKLVLDKGVDINAQNYAGDTALHVVAPAAGVTMKTLLDAGANANLRNNHGDVPLHVALRRPSPISQSTSYRYGYTYSTLQAPETEGATPRGTLLAPLTEKTDINLKDQFGLSPLMLAVTNRDQESRDLINERVPKMDSTTQLFDAVSQGNVAVLTGLLTQKPYLVYFRLADGTTPLHVAAQWGTLAAAQLLVLKGADINARDSRGYTPLMNALVKPTGLFLRRAKNMTAYLLEQKADVNAVDTADMSPLHRAVRSNEMDLVQLLLDKGARLDLRDRNGQTALQYLMTPTSNMKMVQLLVDKGANIGIKDQSGVSPLSRAVTAKRADIVKLLLDKGADMKSRDSQGRGLLGQLLGDYYSSQDDGTRDVLSLLLDKGLDPNDRIYGDSTVLARLISNSSGYSSGSGSSTNRDIIKLLLATKKVNLKPASQTPYLFLAVQSNRRDVFDLLLDAGADINEKDSSGRTLMKVVKERGGDTTWSDYIKTKGYKDE